MYRSALLMVVLFLSLFPWQVAFAQDEDPYRQFDDINARAFPGGRILPPSIDSESARFNSFVDSVYYEYYQIGAANSNSEWRDYSDAVYAQRLQYLRANLAILRSEYDFYALDEETRITFMVFEAFVEMQIKLLEYNSNSYPISHRGGLHISLPLTLMIDHGINNYSDATAYISLLQKIEDAFDQLIENLKSRAANGVVLPKFIFPGVIETASNIIKGAPFDSSGVNSPLLEDFTNKVNSAAAIGPATKTTLISDAESALLNYVGPAYQKLIAYLQELEQAATDEAGVWKMPSGDAYYRMLLNYYTTTDLSPEKIHKRGLKNVRRTHREIRRLMKEVEFESNDHQDFFEFIRTDKQFYYRNSKRGRQRYLDRTEEVIKTMDRRLDDMFITTPDTKLEIRAVEAYREETAGIAFYHPPPWDLSGPGVFYVNLYDMKNQPIYELEALAYHEGIPGHHLQISIARESDFPTYFRKLVGFTGYLEGWALYSEEFPKEFGFYDDPYSDFGRLSMQLWRACRLVVDTGLHFKKWTRDEAINYLLENTPTVRSACTIAIDRYIVMPGQATAYMIGKLKILKLRSKAEKALGADFDIREFHDLLVTNGALPLWLLQQMVEEWINPKGNYLKAPHTNLCTRLGSGSLPRQ